MKPIEKKRMKLFGRKKKGVTTSTSSQKPILVQAERGGLWGITKRGGGWGYTQAAAGQEPGCTSWDQRCESLGGKKIKPGSKGPTGENKKHPSEKSIREGGPAGGGG